jgi:hypothetical protein
MVQAFVEIFIATQDLYCPTVGAAEVVPALVMVVVPEVTALTVNVPAPVFKIVIAVPFGNA